jgi:hypothetical protein
MVLGVRSTYTHDHMSNASETIHESTPDLNIGAHFGQAFVSERHFP